MKYGLATLTTAAVLLAASPAFAANTSSGPASPMSNDSAGNSATAKDANGASPQKGLSATDQAFVKDAARGNFGEVQLGELAAKEAESPAVREFGLWMVSAHGFANRELTTITQRMHQQAATPTLDAEASETMKKLRDLHGAAFDRAYIDAMVADHKTDLKAIEGEDANGQDYLIKSFAQNMTPVIREHLAEAESLQADLAGHGRSAAEHKAVGAAESTKMTGPMKK